MDKKMYMEPEMDVIEIKYNGVLCASDPDEPQVIDGDNDTGDLG